MREEGKTLHQETVPIARAENTLGKGEEKRERWGLNYLEKEKDGTEKRKETSPLCTHQGPGLAGRVIPKGSRRRRNNTIIL